MQKGSLLIFLLMSAHACIAQFNVEMGIPSIHEGINSNFTIIGAYTKVGYQNQKLGYAIFYSSKSTLNKIYDKKTIGTTIDYELKIKKDHWISIKPGIMGVITRDKHQIAIFNNHVYALGPYMGLELKMNKNISLSSHSAIMYGIQEYPYSWGRRKVFHFPIFISLGVNYKFKSIKMKSNDI